MFRRPPRSTRPDTLFPYTTLFRSSPEGVYAAMYFAASRRMGMIAWGFEQVISDSLVLREISDCTAMMEVVALKNKDDERRAVRTFWRSEEHTSELQSLMRISYAVFCLKKKIHTTVTTDQTNT